VNSREKYGLAAAVAVVLAAIWFVQRGPTLRPSFAAPRPLAVVPAGPAFVLSVDLARLRKTPAGLALARAGAERLHATGKRCGFEPLRDMDELVLAVAGEANQPARPGIPGGEAIALIAAGRFVAPVVADCVARETKERGGEPVRTTIGAFVSVRDRKRAGEIAVRDGLYVLGDGPYLRAVLDAAGGHRPDGTAAEQIRDQLHAELRRSFGAGAPIIATLILPEGWLERAIAEPGSERSPLDRVRSAALRADVGARIELRAELACAKLEDAERLEQFLNSARAELGPVLGPELAKRLLDVRIERKGERIELAGTLDAAEAAALFESPK
jgi:hypothetical protein